MDFFFPPAVSECFFRGGIIWTIWEREGDCQFERDLDLDLVLGKIFPGLGLGL